MGVIAVVGANWGDEGKGKITDLLAGGADAVVRYQGGSNAGHTIVNGFGKFGLNMLPSGVFHAQVVNVIGPGVALDATRLLEEIGQLSAQGVPEPRLRISDRAQLVLPVHKLFDELEEERLGDRRFGSTKRGIAPFYADKYVKLGVRVAEVAQAAQANGATESAAVTRLLERLETNLAAKNVLLPQLYHCAPLQAAELLPQLLQIGRAIAPYIADTGELLRELLREGRTIIAEGQLGALRDPDHGIYPYVTSSSTLAGFAAVGAGLPPQSIGRIIAVTKAYSSCVGAGPFVTELFGGEAEELRRRGGSAGEYGVVTGRPRRVGWFDAVATRYGCAVQGATEVALTNLDVLGYLDTIPICTGYVQANGATTERFAADTAELEGARPLLETMQGWRSDIGGVRRYADLPAQAQRYVERLETLIGVPIRIVSVGPGRDMTLERP
ncbi:adenylosuccinate synthase [Paenibacillus cymbidii]|uniref:adenylosuccinate synthase n=1 Tax=Paenibacillus cymbidii TaxID=1639034 RepID=UPI00107FF15D|nr:adenylosuccinate synthase [Paenibacillus cymbidii]